MAEPSKSINIAVMTISDSRSSEDDYSGDLLVSKLTEAGHVAIDRTIVKDDIYAIRAVASRWIADEQVDAIITTGGTGVTGRDGTPEAIEVLLDKRLDGFGELFRQVSFEEIGASTMQSRALGGVANGTYIFALPGSKGACSTAWNSILGSQLDSSTRPCNLVQLMPRLRES